MDNTQYTKTDDGKLQETLPPVTTIPVVIYDRATIDAQVENLTIQLAEWTARQQKAEELEVVVDTPDE